VLQAEEENFEGKLKSRVWLRTLLNLIRFFALSLI